MLEGFYTRQSPLFPSATDFEAFPLWCEWHDSEELTELSNLGLSDESIQDLFIGPNARGEEVYYPVLNRQLSRFREFLFAKATFHIGESAKCSGYLSLIGGHVVAGTMWIDGDDVHLYASDRLVAADENPSVIQRLCTRFQTSSFCSVQYESPVTFDGSRLVGELTLL